jgi:DNA-directed RNA polymerase specialized sigma24 family protein
MVAPNSGYSMQQSPSRERANYAGVNLPVRKRGEAQSNIDLSFESNPERMADASQYMSLVRDCSIQHPEECKYLKYVLLRYMEGMPIRKIAKSMRCSDDTAKGRLTRTLNFLEKFIREQE